MGYVCITEVLEVLLGSKEAPSLLNSNASQEIKDAYENGKSSGGVSIPSQLVPLSQSDIMHSVWTVLESRGTMKGAIRLNQRTIDLAGIIGERCNVGIEFESNVSSLNTLKASMSEGIALCSLSVGMSNAITLRG